MFSETWQSCVLLMIACKKPSFLKTKLIYIFCISGAQVVNFAVVLASSKHLFLCWKLEISNDEYK